MLTGAFMILMLITGLSSSTHSIRSHTHTHTFQVRLTRSKAGSLIVFPATQSLSPASRCADSVSDHRRTQARLRFLHQPHQQACQAVVSPDSLLVILNALPGPNHMRLTLRRTNWGNELEPGRRQMTEARRWRKEVQLTLTGSTWSGLPC